MDFKDILGKLDQLNEAEMTSRKVAGKAYGGSAQADDEDDEDGEKKPTAPEVKRGRGRPRKVGGEAETSAKYGGAAELQKWIVGSVPKKSKELEKLPKAKHKLSDKEPTEKKKVKESLKDYISELDRLIEAEQLTIQPAKSSTQVIKQGNKVLGQVSNPQLAATIKQAIGKGEMSLAGAELGEADYSAKAARAGKDIGKPGKMFSKIAKDAAERYGSKERGEKVAGAVLAKLRKTNEADMPPNDSLASPLTLESTQGVAEGKKPDFLDLDKDGNKKESMKKAAHDAKKDKKKVDEGMDQRLKAAHHRGKAHALAKEGYNCRYDEGSEEARMYHEGYKMGLDECYGIMPMRGVVVGEEMPAATVPGMASQAMPAMEADLEEMDKTEYMQHKAKTTPGDTFKAFGQTMHDKDVLENEFAFEGWDKQLNALLTEGEEVVEEGMSISVSKGQMGAPDSVSVTASDSDADKLMALVKQMGILGGEEQTSDYGVSHADQDTVHQHGDLTVVDDHEGMMALIKKVAGPDMAQGSQDYADEQGSEMDHDHKETCQECGGMMEAGHSCGSKEMVDEVESEDQMEFEVSEDNAPDSDEAETSADEDAEAKEDQALAMKSISEEESEDEEEQDGLEESFANSADDTFEADMDFMTKVISGGLNKQKSTGQTTVPVIPGQKDRMGVDGMKESADSILDWKKLAGIR